jgi:hypothetical protein
MIPNMLILRKMALRMMMTIKAIKIFFIVDLSIVLILSLLGEFQWLLNSQVAFISSLVVTYASFLGYKRNIQKRVQNNSLEQTDFDDSYDELDKMDDQYDLYSPDIPQQQVKEEMTKQQIKEEIKKNKEALKKNNTKNFIGAFGAMSSLYRIGGYAFLIIGFFFLNNNGYLEVVPYIAGFLIVPLSSLILNFTLKNPDLYNTQN